MGSKPLSSSPQVNPIQSSLKSIGPSGSRGILSTVLFFTPDGPADELEASSDGSSFIFLMDLNASFYTYFHIFIKTTVLNYIRLIVD